MYQQTYFVDKRTGTFADVCMAYGLAVILDKILGSGLGEQRSRTVRILDKGSAYAIDLSSPLQEKWIESCRFFAPIPFIKTAKNKDKMPKGIIAIDYDKEKARYDAFKKLRETLGKTKDTDAGETAILLKEAAPAPDYSVWQKINMMAALSTYNEAANIWHENEENFNELLKLLLKLFAETPNAVEACENDWKGRLKKAKPMSKGKIKKKVVQTTAGVFAGEPKLNALQVFNPSMGKGQNYPKANHLAMDNVDNFWLCEYVKMVGFYRCALPRFVLAKKGEPPKNRKTFALAPANITLSAHEAIWADFRNKMSSSHAIKSDIFAALRYTECFLQYCEAAQEEDLAAALWGKSPENFVAGLHTAFYKNLGNSLAVMNLSFINLPNWMIVTDAAAAQIYREIIVEHLAVVNNLDEERSEGHTLLQHYRDFLSGHDITAFFEFTAGYANYLLNALTKEPCWVKPLSETNLRRLLMSSESKLTPIIENRGFQNIAKAIRQSTVTLQYLAKKGKPPYDIRYGLGQELRRRANYPEEFIQALGDFLHLFNAENAKKAESSPERHWRKSVREDDIAEVVHLIDKYGAPLVCHLLLAFGYASASKEDETTNNDSTSTNS